MQSKENRTNPEKLKTGKEIRINPEKFVNARALMIFLSIIMFMILQVSLVDADEGEFNKSAETAIELIVDANLYDDNFIESAIADANQYANTGTDVEQQTNPEPEINTLSVVIGNGDNVRSLSDNFGNVDSTFPRGNNVEVIGYFNDGPLQSIASGTWLILEDGQHAIFSGVVTESSDGSPITDAEAATTPRYLFDGSSYVLEVPEEPTEEAAPVAPTDSPEEEVTPNPILLEFPDLPDSREITYLDPTNYTRGEPITETLEFNLDNRLPIALGEVPQGTHPIIDSIAQYEIQGDGTNEEDWARIPVSGVIVSVDSDPRYPDDRKSITILTVDANGDDILVRLDIMPYIHLYPVNDRMELTIPQADADAIYHMSRPLGEDVIRSVRDVVPGDQIIFDMVNVPQGEGGNTPFSTPWRANTMMNGVVDGTPTAVFEAAANDEIDRDIPVVFAWGGNYIIFNHDN